MWIFVVIALVAVVLVVAGAMRSRQTRLEREARRARETDQVRKLTDEDVTALGEELQSLDIELAGRELDEGARADYQRALDAYEAAKAAVSAIDKSDDARDVTAILEDGRYAMACVRARVDGRELPPRRAPCFFDPRHGVSVADVTYTPPGGTPREVPACALDAERVRAGAEPDIRQVMDGPRRVPYWQGGRAYAPYAAGYFSTFNILPALFLGTMVGSAFGGGFDGSYDSGYDEGYQDGQDSDGDSGDGGSGDGGGGDGGGFNGGDGGGGFNGGGIGDGSDFGGDFGGGDFGDFGGGDFGG
jgi:hypothetical protein